MQRRNLGLSLVAVLLTACLYYRGGFVLLIHTIYPYFYS